ncbi:class I SAM-dependent methyltransferase [Paraburkholderia sp. A1BS-2L]|uniref:SAM-dependent methyltransferase n=1 Tax=Paraburkholderia sp. A1BS-2L TaxID=3028373 RepID=UPI003DA80023
MKKPKNRTSQIGFEDFRRLARDESLSKYERIGFPDEYREGFERQIFDDIAGKLYNLQRQQQTVLDIGPGCSDLPNMLINLCERNGHSLTLVDSEEMLRQLDDRPFLSKVTAPYPDCPELIDGLSGAVDVILCYSVLQYIVLDTAFFRFLDDSLSLLAPGGQMLIGDIPNVSKRKRFFSSEAGIRFHKDFMRTADEPVVRFNQIEHDQIDDAIVFAILGRARSAGFDAYLLPQARSLPMANRREDILIQRP